VEDLVNASLILYIDLRSLVFRKEAYLHNAPRPQCPCVTSSLGWPCLQDSLASNGSSAIVK